MVTSSSIEQIEDWAKSAGEEFHFCHADERVLKTMIRSNPGLMLIKDGNVINKWADNEVKYVAEKVKENNFSKILIPHRNFSTTLIVIILLFVVPLLIIKLLDIKLQKKK